MISGWNKFSNISAWKYRCGYCGSGVASNIGYDHYHSNWKIWVCPNCDRPTYTNGNQITPCPIPGNEVNHLPDDLNDLYREARKCCSISAYTASVLACRKLLMNVAVSQGAKEGLKFIEYVDHLSDKGFIPAIM